MLSRTLRSALRDARSPLPPTFLLPWIAGLSSVSHTPPTPPPASVSRPGHPSSSSRAPLQRSPTHRRASPPALASPPPAPLMLARSVRELLPVLQAQAPHYATLHIHGFPYLVTAGDSVRLPFLMAGVAPGDVLRLNRAVHLGSRDLTLKASAPAAKIKSPAAAARHVAGPPAASAAACDGAAAPHFIPHMARGKHSYIDDRLFVCRAVVMGVESEPMRVKEKTKRRNRHVRRVKSKHRYTVLKITELSINTPDQVDAECIRE